MTTPTHFPLASGAGRAGADRIVVVDDDDATVALLTELLTRAGVSEVHGVSDAREALRIIREVDADLVLLDLMMPYVDGYEILARLRDGDEAGVFRPVLVMTGDASPAARARALALEATDVLVKPVPMRQTIQHVLALLRARHAARADRVVGSRPPASRPARL
ncbi:MAG: response regulator [Trueperaceae bacterium]